MAYSQTEMLEKEVYLFERIDRLQLCEPMRYLKCIVFLRPTNDNIKLLLQEMKRPKFGQYFVCKLICKRNCESLHNDLSLDN